VLPVPGKRTAGPGAETRAGLPRASSKTKGPRESDAPLVDGVVRFCACYRSGNVPGSTSVVNATHASHRYSGIDE